MSCYKDNLPLEAVQIPDIPLSPLSPNWPFANCPAELFIVETNYCRSNNWINSFNLVTVPNEGKIHDRMFLFSWRILRIWKLLYLNNVCLWPMTALMYRLINWVHKKIILKTLVQIVWHSILSINYYIAYIIRYANQETNIKDYKNTIVIGSLC